MEIKKSPKADLQNKRGLLLEIGLVISLCLVIGAFAYTPKERKIEKMDLQTAVVEEEIVEITRQDQKPPEPPKRVEVKVIADLLQVVTNDTKITTEVDFAEFDENTEVIQQVEVAEETIEDDQPFLIAETMPSFQGGDLNTFRNPGSCGSLVRDREGRPSDQYPGASDARPFALRGGHPRTEQVSEVEPRQTA